MKREKVVPFNKGVYPRHIKMVKRLSKKFGTSDNDIVRSAIETYYERNY